MDMKSHDKNVRFTILYSVRRILYNERCVMYFIHDDRIERASKQVNKQTKNENSTIGMIESYVNMNTSSTTYMSRPLHVYIFSVL